MFDLETSIAEWRKQMLSAGIKSPVPLEELENHLREEIERQLKSGRNQQAIFNSAVQKIGPGNVLKREFKIAGKHHYTFMKIFKKSLGVFSLFVALYCTLSACFIFNWSLHYYYGDDVLPGTVFTVDGVKMNWFWIFLPVVVHLTIAGGALRFGLKILKSKHVEA